MILAGQSIKFSSETITISSILNISSIGSTLEPKTNLFIKLNKFSLHNKYQNEFTNLTKNM